MMGFIALLINWTGFGTHLALSVLSADMCNSINDYVANNGQITETKGLEFALACIDNTTLIPVQNVTQEAMNSQLAIASQQLSNTLGINITVVGNSSIPQTNTTIYYGNVLSVRHFIIQLIYVIIRLFLPLVYRVLHWLAHCM